MMTRYAATLLVLTAPALAGKLRFVPLQDYIGQPGVVKDPAALGYVADRCSALYAVFAKGLEGETDPKRQKVKAEFVSRGEKFMAIAVKLMMTGTTIRMKDALARTRNTVIELGNLYSNRIEVVKNLTNNRFSDPLISGDFAICNGLLKKM